MERGTGQIGRGYKKGNKKRNKIQKKERYKEYRGHYYISSK